MQRQHSSPGRSLRLLFPLLLTLALSCSGSDDKKDKTPKETGPKPPGDSITLKFDWPESPMAVEFSRTDIKHHPKRGREAKTLDGTATLTATPSESGGAKLHVELSKLSSKDAAPEEQEKLLAVNQAVGRLPLGVDLNTRGEVVTVEDAQPKIDFFLAELEKQMRAQGAKEEVVEATIASLKTGLDSATISSITGKFYYSMLAQWSGLTLKKGEPRVVVVEEPLGLPVEADKPIKFTTTMLYEGAVPCTKGATKPLCVKLSAQTSVDEQAATPIYEAYFNAALAPALELSKYGEGLRLKMLEFRSIARVELIAKPDTLEPRSFVMDFANTYVTGIDEKSKEGTEAPPRIKGGQEVHQEFRFAPQPANE